MEKFFLELLKPKSILIRLKTLILQRRFFRWFRKAGGYAIQSLGAKFVKKIRGCYTNIVGISIPELYKILKVQRFD